MLRLPWASRSAAVRRERNGHFDVRYGDTPRERIDLFPAADPRAPTLAFIHGGYWQMNDKESFAFLADGLVPRGINFALVEYTLAPAARISLELLPSRTTFFTMWRQLMTARL